MISYYLLLFSVLCQFLQPYQPIHFLQCLHELEPSASEFELNEKELKLSALILNSILIDHLSAVISEVVAVLLDCLKIFKHLKDLNLLKTSLPAEKLAE
jgi:hypothetical protein